MKRNSLTLFLFAFCFGSKAGQEMHLEWDSALPLQAATSDLTGVGHAISQSETSLVFKIDQLWFGNVTNDTVTFNTSYLGPLPTNGCHVIFFASKRQSFLSLKTELHYSWIFNMQEYRSTNAPDGLHFFALDRSWFPVTTENEAMVNWSSNLVHSAQVTTNRQAFYELIRDGYRLHPESSRIHRDSEYTFMYSGLFMSTDFMSQIWTDTKLLGRARSWVNMSYQQKTQTWLPRLNDAPVSPEGGVP